MVATMYAVITSVVEIGETHVLVSVTTQENERVVHVSRDVCGDSPFYACELVARSQFGQDYEVYGSILPMTESTLCWVGVYERGANKAAYAADCDYFE